MRTTLLSLLAAFALTLALPSPVHAEDEYTTLASQLSDFGVELSADEAAAVAAFDAKQGDGYEWEKVDPADEKSATYDAAIIGKIKDVAYGSGRFITDNLWLMISAGLVFIMHLGFATLETGLCRSKNAVNVLFKNTLVPCIGLLLYAFIGFNLMYPCGNWAVEGVIPNIVLGISAGDLSNPATFLATMTGKYGVGAYTWWTDFLFQGMFAATAMTIVSGSVYERINHSSFLVFTVFYVGLVYPFVGSWHWGAGWLYEQGFIDFAGSTLVHSVGGWGGLAGILVLGSRLGKYGPDGSVRPIAGHNLPLAVIGVFLLWLGWFGFNGGSVLSAAPDAVSYVLTTTCLAAAMGGVAAAMTSWIVGKKPDLTMALNGILAGLVGITANAHIASLMGAVLIGLITGVLVYFAVLFFDKLKIDDPVGALSVHLVCGIFGTLACGIPFLMLPGLAGSFLTQLTGVLSYGALCFPAALVFWFILKAVMGIRVSPQEEEEGLDLGEHGMHCYNTLEVR